MQKEVHQEVKFEAELRLRGFSETTISTYQKHVSHFLKSFNQNPEDLTENDIRIYFGNLTKDKVAPRTLALKKAALKFFYNEVIKKDIIKLKTPKIPKSVFEVLSKEEIKRLIENTGSRKTRLMTKFLYGTGLRVSELVNLKKKDIELDSKTGWVRKGKGAKDRFFPLSEMLCIELAQFIEQLPAEHEYLFGGRGGKKLTTRSVQKMLQLSGKKAQIEKQVTPHKLRHSYATHLLDAGVDIILIQELLGHNSLSTTKTYTHVSKEHLKRIKNPLDSLFAPVQTSPV